MTLVRLQTLNMQDTETKSLSFIFKTFLMTLNFVFLTSVAALRHYVRMWRLLDVNVAETEL